MLGRARLTLHHFASHNPPGQLALCEQAPVEMSHGSITPKTAITCRHASSPLAAHPAISAKPEPKHTFAFESL